MDVANPRRATDYLEIPEVISPLDERLNECQGAKALGIVHLRSDPIALPGRVADALGYRLHGGYFKDRRCLGAKNDEGCCCEERDTKRR